VTLMTPRSLRAIAAGLCWSAAASAWAGDAPQRLVVRLKAGAEGTREAAQSATRALAPGAQHLRTTAFGAHVVQLPAGTTAAEAAALARRLAAQNPAVQSAEADLPLRSHAEAVTVPDAYAPLTADTYAHQQWPLMGREPGRVGRANFGRAWQRTTGHDDVVVAVLDSGGTHHPDTLAREHAGFDFITELPLAADGSGRDADATDPGDFCASGIGDSDWHGTAAAGMIAAVPGNAYGVAGAAPGVRLQHVRVLGRCGAWSSDVADAIVWAAGGQVPGVPANATPARVINLSLGAPADACSAFMQDAVDAAARLGAVVVASAGNEGRRGIDMPANCRGVLAVAAATESGDLAHYSNHAPGIALAAPAGGECKTQRESCIAHGAPSVGTLGRTVFEGHAEVRYFGGTSAAAPHVAAAAALVVSANPALTPREVASVLRASAWRGLPADSFCAAGRDCGAGLLDAHAAVLAADGPVLSIEGPLTSPRASQSVRLTASASLAGHAVQPVSVQWLQVDGPGVAMTGADTLSMAFTVPAGLASGQVLAFEASAVFADGRIVQDSIVLAVAAAPSDGDEPLAVPADPGATEPPDGGGGATSISWLALLALAAARLPARRARRPDGPAST
jgi:serine protease